MSSDFVYIPIENDELPLQPTIGVKFGYSKITPEIKQEIMNDFPGWIPLEDEEKFVIIHPETETVRLYQKDNGRCYILPVEIAKKWGLIL